MGWNLKKQEENRASPLQAERRQAGVLLGAQSRLQGIKRKAEKDLGLWRKEDLTSLF